MNPRLKYWNWNKLQRDDSNDKKRASIYNSIIQRNIIKMFSAVLSPLLIFSLETNIEEPKNCQ